MVHLELNSPARLIEVIEVPVITKGLQMSVQRPSPIKTSCTVKFTDCKLTDNCSAEKTPSYKLNRFQSSSFVLTNH